MNKGPRPLVVGDRVFFGDELLPSFVGIISQTIMNIIKIPIDQPV